MKENDLIRDDVFDLLLGAQDAKRVYAVSNMITKELVGIFTNRKILLGALVQAGLPENSYVQGSRARRSVTTSSIATGFCRKALNIFYTDMYGEQILMYRVLEITLNRLNPKYMPDFDNN